MRFVLGMMLVAMSFGSIGLTGCGSKGDPKSSQLPSGEKKADEQAEGEHASHDHGGWWCSEHGVPEEECALCDTSLIATFKAKGDWCEEHLRPESQCFACDPERFTHFAERYEAKFGEQPPKPTE